MPDVLALKVMSELQEMLKGCVPVPDGLRVRVTSSSCATGPGSVFVDTQNVLVCTVVVARDVLWRYGHELGAVHDIHMKVFELVAEHGMPSVVVSVLG